MEKFQKLSRAEMKNVKGGVTQGCSEVCTVFYFDGRSTHTGVGTCAGCDCIPPPDFPGSGSCDNS
ncbi:MAG: hypothetical protein M3N14_02690 [Bacteroidota bacterium]|nr:hypothetical protein [Bacteroidota bacterium]